MAGAKSRGEEEEDGWVSIELVSRDERGVGCCERDDELWCAWGGGLGGRCPPCRKARDSGEAHCRLVIKAEFK